MRPYRFHADALAEYEEAAAWYAGRSPAAADKFVEVIEDAIVVIRELPLAWPVWPGQPDARMRVLRRMPYTIVYVPQPDEIVIVAVAHQRRRPGYWLERLGP